jgi:hypothetical protein
MVAQRDRLSVVALRRIQAQGALLFGLVFSVIGFS